MSKVVNKQQELLDKVELLATNKKLKASVYLQKTKDVAKFLMDKNKLYEDDAWRTAHGLILREIVTGDKVICFEGLTGDFFDRINPKSNRRTCGYELIDCSSMKDKYPVFLEPNEFDEITYGPCSTFFVSGLLIKRTKGEGNFLEILISTPSQLTPKRIVVKPVRANIERTNIEEATIKDTQDEQQW